MHIPGLVAALILVGASPAFAQWVDWPPKPRDADLEAMVRAAYVAATEVARLDLNYFERDGKPEALHEAIIGGLIGAGYEDVAVEMAADTEPERIRACASSGTVLRYAVNVFGDGISLAAASEKRVFSYQYDPHQSLEIVVDKAAPC